MLLRGRHSICIPVITALVMFLSAPAARAVPPLMNYQGYLTTTSGQPLEGPASLAFAIYADSTGGSPLWSETHEGVAVHQGIFSVLLGSATALPATLFSSSSLWLETALNGIPLQPRRLLASVPFALHAAVADSALAGPGGGDGLWQTNGSSVWRSGGNVGIGLANPQSGLDVIGNIKLRLSAAGNNSGMSLSTAPEAPSIGFHASDNSERFTLATTFSADNNNDLLRFNGSVAGNALVLKGNGNVGLGTASPAERLHVAGNARLEGSVYLGENQGVNFHATGGDIPVLSMTSTANVTMLAGNTMYFGLINGGGTVMSIDHTGLVRVSGDLCVTGQKNRVVETPYGALKFNATESAAAWFTTEGEARLDHGRRRIDLDPTFLAAVTVDNSHHLVVNVTFYGPHGDFYVSRDATGFSVIDPSTSDSEFSWEVKAKQKGYEDIYLQSVQETATHPGR